MYYSKTAALDRHVCELHNIITKIEPKAPQPNASTENKCKMSRRELNNRIERLVLLAYTLRRKSSNEPFVPATEQEWAHLYMNGMCVKKYYTCQGRQVYVPKKIADSTGRGCGNSSDSEKYNTYLDDNCGGKGKGGGAGGEGGSNIGGGSVSGNGTSGGDNVSNGNDTGVAGNNDWKKSYQQALEDGIKNGKKKKFINDLFTKINISSNSNNIVFIYIHFDDDAKLLIKILIYKNNEYTLNIIELSEEEKKDFQNLFDDNVNYILFEKNTYYVGKIDDIIDTNKKSLKKKYNNIKNKLKDNLSDKKLFYLKF